MAIKLLEAAERIDIIQAINKRLREIKAGTEYTAGEGVSIDESNAISLKIDETQENAASINENGLFVEKSEPVEPGKEYTAGVGIDISESKISVAPPALYLYKAFRYGPTDCALTNSQLDVSNISGNFFQIYPQYMTIAEGDSITVYNSDRKKKASFTIDGASITSEQYPPYYLFFVSAHSMHFICKWSYNINDEPVIAGPGI